MIMKIVMLVLFAMLLKLALVLLVGQLGKLWLIDFLEVGVLKIGWL